MFEQIKMREGVNLTFISATVFAMTFLVGGFFVATGTALAAVPTPSTNDINRTNGWAHVDQLSQGVGTTELQFISTRLLNHGGSCFEYRTDGDTSQQKMTTTPPIIPRANYNPLVLDGLYPFYCQDNDNSIHTITANAYVEVRMVFGAEGTERFDWTRFNVIPAPSLAAQDFGVVNYDVGEGLGMLKGYTAGFGLSDATLAGATSVVVQLFAYGEDEEYVLMQTNTAILPKFNDEITGTEFSSPFDVSGTFDYATDGYWTNVKEAQYGQSVPATKVVATITLANGTVVTVENTELMGEPTTIYPPADTTPDAFSFTDKTGVALSTVIESNTIAVAGINADADVSVVGGEYSINDGEYTSISGAVSIEDTVKVHHTSSDSNSTAVETTLIIGGVSAIFTSTTVAAESHGSSGSRAHRATPAIPAVPGVTPAFPAIPSANSNRTVAGGLFTFIRDLGLGDQGADVTELQNRLTREGVYTGPITGYFGPLTFAGVQAYQRKMGIIDTGFVGPLTRGALNHGDTLDTLRLELLELLKQLLAQLQAQLDAQ